MTTNQKENQPMGLEANPNLTTLGSGQADLGTKTERELVFGRYGLASYVILSPENDEGNWYLNHLEMAHLLPITTSWLDENGWVNRLFARPPGLLPQSMTCGFAHYRFLTGDWKGDQIPMIYEWLPLRSYLHLEPAEIPLDTLDMMAKSNEVLAL